MARPHAPWLAEQVVERLRSLADPASLAGMARYGIGTGDAFGVRMPVLRALAKEIGRDHALAEALWSAGGREARIVATLIADPDHTDEAMMERWAAGFADWEVCDQCCMNLFAHAGPAYVKSIEWSGRRAEFVKRAGFVLMARLAAADKRPDSQQFAPFLDAIRREACDDRNYVKKAVSWALRQIGKRDQASCNAAIETAHALQAMDCRAARWIAADTLADLATDATRSRLAKRSAGS